MQFNTAASSSPYSVFPYFMAPSASSSSSSSSASQYMNPLSTESTAASSASSGRKAKRKTGDSDDIRPEKQIRIEVLVLPNLPNVVLTIILCYANTITPFVRTLSPNYETLTQLAERSVWRESTAGGSIFLERIAGHLKISKHPSRVNKILRFANHWKDIENPNFATHPHAEKMSLLAANALWVKSSVVDVIKEIQDDDLMTFSFVGPSSLKNVIKLARFKKIVERNQQSQLPTFNDARNISQERDLLIQFCKIVTDRKERAELAILFMENCLQWQLPEEAEEFLNQADHDLLPQDVKIFYRGRITDYHLSRSNTCVWDRFKLTLKSPQVSSEETMVANVVLKEVIALIQSNKIDEALKIMKENLVDIHAENRVLKFPDQCAELMKLILERGPITDEKKLGDILHFILNELPDDERKLQMLRRWRMEISQAQSYQKDSASSSSMYSGTVAQYYYLPRILNSAIAEMERRPRRLFKLAQIFLSDGDNQRAFFVASQLSSPKLVFAILDLALNHPFSTKDVTAFLQLNKNLPPEFRYTIIVRAIEKKQTALVSALEKDFDREAFRKTVSTQVTLNLRVEGVLEVILRKTVLGEQDFNQIYLLAMGTKPGEVPIKISSKLRERLQKEMDPNHEIPIEERISEVRDLEDAVKTLERFDRVRSSLCNVAYNVIGAVNQTYGLPNSLRLGIAREAQRMLRESRVIFAPKSDLVTLSSTIENQLETWKKGTVENEEREYRRIREISVTNPFVIASTVDVLLQSDLQVAFLFRAYRANPEVDDILKESGLAGLFESCYSELIKSWFDNGVEGPVT